MANRFVLNETSYHGAGAIANIAVEAKNRAFKKAFVCSDPDLIKFGVTKKVLDVLDKDCLAYEVYDNIKPNPTIENVQSGVAAFKKSGADYLIAIGGGSSMDTAKAIGIIINNPEFADVRSLEGVAPTKKPAVPIIAVPTTAGTAAEVTINYVITDVEKNRKMVCVDPHDIPVVAVVDPEMMASMPKGLTAATGMDALTHAIEGYITKAAWELSDMLKYAIAYDAPIALRYPRGEAYDGLQEHRQPIVYGKCEEITVGQDILLFALGSMVKTAEAVCGQLKEKGIEATLVNARFAKPFDAAYLKEAMTKHSMIVILEENVALGGFGEHVACFLRREGYEGQILSIAIGDHFVEHGNVAVLQKELGIDADGITRQILEKL